MVKENFIELFADSFRKNWDLPGYKGLRREQHHPRDDKIVLIGRNSSNWAITYVATVPTVLSLHYPARLQPERRTRSIANHSESKLLFTGDSIWESLKRKAHAGQGRVLARFPLPRCSASAGR